MLCQLVKLRIIARSPRGDILMPSGQFSTSKEGQKLISRRIRPQLLDYRALAIRSRPQEVETTMAWRFQASKFKNTTPKLPKKEATIFDLPIGNLSCTNNGIQSSDQYLAFHIEGEGGKLGIVATNARGRRLRDNIGVVCAHGDQVDDFSFLPYAQDLLLTCSRDEKLKLWKISGDATISNYLEAEVDLGGVQLDALKPHSTAAGIVAVASSRSGFVVDLEHKKVAYEVTGLTDRGQSVDWSPDGRLLAISADKGKQICVYDPRAGLEPIQNFESHQGMGREGRILFCGDRLLSSGFTNKRVQEVRLYETGKWGAPVHIQEFVSTTGVLIPHYDPDTKLLFLTGKGTNKMFLMEQQDRQPLLSQVYEMTLPEQSVGACLGTKRHLNVMEGEVDVFYQLTKNSIVPIPCIVPRRSYRDFHTDLFPDTIGAEAACSASEWLGGCDKLPGKISLAPGGSPANPSPPPQEPTPPSVKQPPAPETPVAIVRKPRNEIEEPAPPKEVKELKYEEKKTEGFPDLNKALRDLEQADTHSTPVSHQKTNPEDVENVRPPSPVRSAPAPIQTPAQTPTVKLRGAAPDSSARQLSARARPKSCVVGMVASKFRHVETIVGIKANNSVFSNLRNVNTRLPPESNGACASGQFIAVPLSGPAGVVGIYNVDQPEKIPDGVMDGIFNKANITDIQWNPFNDGELAVGTDAGILNIWRVSTEDGPRNEMEPAVVLRMAGEKILTLRWHPLASNLLAVALSDNSIEIWDTEKQERKNKFTTHSGAVLSIAWSANGVYLASLGKDALINIHEPQLGADCLIRQKKVLENTRAARVLWACDDRALLVVGFTRGSERVVQLLEAYDLKLLHTQHIDSATQPLVPHYDYDTNVLFLAGKGDRILNMYEVCADSPYLLQLTPYMAPMGGQAIAFHNKKKCDVMAVEFQRAWRLTEKSLELMIFRVPRVRKDVFQSDLFPDALVTWRSAMTASEWLAGDNRGPNFESLRPDGVGALSNPATPSVPQLARRSAFPEDIRSTPRAAPVMEEKQLINLVPQNGDDLEMKKKTEAEVQASWSSQINKDTTLEQDRMEGVAEEEWS